MDDLSRYGREECHGHYVGFNAEHTGAAAGGAACTKFFSGGLEGGPNSPLAARLRRWHSLLKVVTSAWEG